jgi:predicted RNA binding protein YcfA (HicA-like mRNA interferase family)
MPGQVERRDVERWLLDHGFVRLPGKKTSHLQFSGHGIKVTLAGHGPQDLTKKNVALISRQLKAVGLTPDFLNDKSP